MKIAQLIANRPGSEVFACDAQASVAEVIALLAEKRIGAMPVLEGGRVAGIFSERDVVYRMAQEGAACLERRVGEVMTAPAITVEPDMAVLEALALMTRRRIRHLPVVENDVMCGFISIGDLVKSRIDEIAQEAEAMRTYIMTG
jgi:CBS domain-containing protein